LKADFVGDGEKPAFQSGIVDGKLTFCLLRRKKVSIDMVFEGCDGKRLSGKVNGRTARLDGRARGRFEEKMSKWGKDRVV